MPDDFTSKNRDRWTKIMFVVLVFFGMATLIVGIWKINSTLAPVEIADSGADSPSDLSSGLEINSRSIEDLESSDTDGDGLTDFDELYVYKTSMYLADSDSDGYLDKDEIDGGYDPNCPKGQDCRGTADSAETSVASPVDNEINTPSAEDTGNTALPLEVKTELQNMTPAEIRQLLLTSGEISEEELNQIDDDTLMELVAEMLK